MGMTPQHFHEYILGHCGIYAASRHKLCFHKQALLTTHSYMTQQHSTKKKKKKKSQSKLIFEVPATTWGVPPRHNLIINALLDANADRKLGQVYGQWMTEDSQNYLLTDLEGEESISMDFQVCQPQKYRVQHDLNWRYFSTTKPGCHSQLLVTQCSCTGSIICYQKYVDNGCSLWMVYIP